MDKRISQLYTNSLRFNQTNTHSNAEKKSVDFNNILDKKINEHQLLKFSKHANLRLAERDINLSEADVTQIANAISRAESKGIKNALIVSDTVAYIANIKSKTIVTAVDNIKGKVFTNVDGVVTI